MPKIAFIGSGASTQGYIRGILNYLKSENFSPQDLATWEIDIFEQAARPGIGLPYDSDMTDPRHLMNVPVYSSSVPHDDKEHFLKWINEELNRKKINHELKKLLEEKFETRFETRFKQKYDARLFTGKTIFDEGYEQTEGYQKYSSEIPEFREFHQRSLDIWRDLPERYLRAVEKKDFVSRVVFGMYMLENFTQLIDEAKAVFGQDNVRVHAKSEVTDVDVAHMRLTSGETHQFDHIVFATGRQHKEQEDGNKSYVRNIWPFSKVHEAVERTVAQAHEQGRQTVNIAIEGSSLSAIDVARALEEYQDQGVKVEMVSRNGFLQKVRGSFNWLWEEIGRFYPSALHDVLEPYGYQPLKKDFNSKEEFMEYAKKAHEFLLDKVQGDAPKIHLWQAAKLFTDILAKAYENDGQNKKARDVREFGRVIEANKDNYQEIIKAFLELNPHSKAFDQLAQDLRLAKQPMISENIAELFIEFCDFKPRLPNDEKFFYQNYFHSLVVPYLAPMPTESAQDLLHMHENGMLEVRAMGHNLRRGADGPYFLDSEGVRHDYDLIINARGNTLNIAGDAAPQVYRGVATDGLKVTRAIVAQSQEEYDEMTRKFGSQALTSLKRDGTEYFYDMGQVDTAALKIGEKSSYPQVCLLRNVGGVSGATNSGKKMGREFAKEFCAFERSQKPAVVVARTEHYPLNTTVPSLSPST